MGFACGVTLGGLIFTLELQRHAHWPARIMVQAGLHSGMLVVSFMALAAAALCLFRGHPSRPLRT